MKRLLFSLICLLLFAGVTLGQGRGTSDATPKPKHSQQSGNLTISQDPCIDSMINKHSHQKKQIHSGMGYRIQILTASGQGARERAVKAKTQIMINYPDLDVYVQFTSPDWKVRVGNFRNRTEALKVKRILNGSYPNSFIVPDRIEFTGCVEKTNKQGLQDE